MKDNQLPEGLTLCFVHKTNKDYIHLHLLRRTDGTHVSATVSADGELEMPLTDPRIVNKLPPLSGHILHDAIVVSRYLHRNGYTECKTIEQSRWGK